MVVLRIGFLSSLRVEFKKVLSRVLFFFFFLSFLPVWLSRLVVE